GQRQPHGAAAKRDGMTHMRQPVHRESAAQVFARGGFAVIRLWQAVAAMESKTQLIIIGFRDAAQTNFQTLNKTQRFALEIALQMMMKQPVVAYFITMNEIANL